MAKNEVIILHNPRCTKSRETLALITEKGVVPKILEYLKEAPDYTTLKDILVKLNLKPTDIIRTGETLYKDKFKGKKFSDEEWIKILTENPVLIERPIVIRGNKAIIGRPPKNVLDLF